MEVHQTATAIQTQGEISTKKVWLKVVYLSVITIFFLLGSLLVFQKVFLPQTNLLDRNVLLRVRYKPVLWQTYGEVFEPLVQLPVSYPQGYKSEEFLLDSGALVSSLPRERASQMGFSLSRLPRVTFRGFGGTTSFAYNANLKVLLGNNEVELPVVFTEAAGTKPILGRSGFFEKYSVHFNSRDKVIEITK